MTDNDIIKVAEIYSRDARFLSNSRDLWLEVAQELHQRFGYTVGDEIWDAACRIFLDRVKQDYCDSDEG